MQSLNTAQFKKGLLITFLLSVLTLGASFWLGKNNLFLLLNTNLGIVADYFFAAWTYTGDGSMWILALLVVLKLKKKQYLPLLVSGFVWSTIFTQVCKYLIVPDEPRPIKAIADTSLIHTVKGVELHTVSSFPSGHTATAFTFYLLFCLLLEKRWWLWVGLLYALLVAYSRVYLAQHFPLDTGAGMATAFVSAVLSLWIQQRVDARRLRRQASGTVE